MTMHFYQVMWIKLGRYPDEICPKCKINHRKGSPSKNEMRIQQTFYYEASLSNNRVPNEYRWKTYRCIDCDMFVMFIEHHIRPKNMTELNSIVDSITIELIKQNDKFRFDK